MRLYLLDKLVCPHCGHFPLTAKVSKEREGPTLAVTVRPCEIYCAYEDRWIGKDPQFVPPCSACLRRQIWSGHLICAECNAHYPISERIPSFLTDDDMNEWVTEEKVWWEDHYKKIARQVNITGSGNTSHVTEVPGNRTFERNKYLFHPLRDKGIVGQFLLEIGAGTAQHIAKLFSPAQENYFYVGTDVAREALYVGAQLIPEGDFIQCTVGELPFRGKSVDVLLSLGVLHHIPLWRQSLEKALELLKPSGWILFNEAVDKPRVFGHFRKRSLTANIDSPHEGEVAFDELLTALRERGTLVTYRLQTTPLRVLLVWTFGSMMEHSLLTTKIVLAADQIVLHSIGRLVKSLGPGESLGIFEKASARDEDSRRS